MVLGLPGAGIAQRSDRPLGGGCHGRPGARPGDDACGQGSSAGGFSRMQANDMCRQKREHVEIPDTFEFLSELGANGCAVVVAGRDVAGYPSPLPVRESAVYLVSHQQVMGLPEHQIRLSKGVIAYSSFHWACGQQKAGSLEKAAGCLQSVELKKATVAVAFWDLGCGQVCFYFSISSLANWVG
jgi:hypothetical protein